jgi:hypothetical protein
MLNTLHSQPPALARVKAAPLVVEREQYLQLCTDRGYYSREASQKISWILLAIVSHVPLDRRIIELVMIEQAAMKHKVRFKRAFQLPVVCAVPRGAAGLP